MIEAEIEHSNSLPVAGTFTVTSSSLLAACGGGGGGSSGGDPPSGVTAPVSPEAKSVFANAAQASRFLQMASFGPNAAELSSIEGQSANDWFEQQVNLPRSQSNWDWLIQSGYGQEADRNNRTPFDQAMWKKFLTSPDQLRQRMVYALSQILVIGADGITSSWPHFSAAHYFDLLDEECFGNFRSLLEKVSLSVAMGIYLSHRGNRKEDVASGRMPDENYAREIMQLFTIGLYELNNDGSLKLSNGQPIETYDQADVTGLAKVFTGWDFANSDNTNPVRNQLPMTLTASQHSSSAKSFLSANIPANTTGANSLKIALDTLFMHPNVGPFIGKQLIQRFVSSNPSAAYVSRVADAFNNTQGVRGDLKATLKAVLLDSEALSPPTSSTGKLTEPVLRLTQWARAFAVNSATSVWAGNTSDPATRLGQSPGRSSSVFNFFRPGYLPPSTHLASRGLLAPELQITHETSVAGYVNYMQSIIPGTSNLTPNYDTWLLPITGTRIVDNVDTLLTQLNVLLAAGRLSANAQSTIKTALQTMPITTDAQRKNRLNAAILLTMASPDYIAFK
jgi:uncharacterized protein (DUF1800 family)